MEKCFQAQAVILEKMAAMAELQLGMFGLIMLFLSMLSLFVMWYIIYKCERKTWAEKFFNFTWIFVFCVMSFILMNQGITNLLIFLKFKDGLSYLTTLSFFSFLVFSVTYIRKK